MLKLLMKTEVVGQPAVELFQTGFGCAVRYGLQVGKTTDFESALQEYTGCILHAMGCAGLTKDEEGEEE